MKGPNSQTRRINYPLPVIEDLLVKQGAKQMFSILDLKQAFHQQPMAPASRHITTSWTPMGLFQWKVNVMGLTNAPQQFQQMIDWALREVRDVADAYIDDWWEQEQNLGRIWWKNTTKSCDGCWKC
jgi:hypothetical protein